LVTHRGFAPINPPVLQHPCRVLGDYTDPQVPDGLAQHFHQKYSSSRTKVVVLMAPVPDCAGSEQFKGPHPHVAWIAPSAVFPAAEFGADGRHLQGFVATSYTRAMGRQIQKYLATTGTSLQQGATN